MPKAMDNAVKARIVLPASDPLFSLTCLMYCSAWVYSAGLLFVLMPFPSSQMWVWGKNIEGTNLVSEL